MIELLLEGLGGRPLVACCAAFTSSPSRMLSRLPCLPDMALFLRCMRALISSIMLSGFFTSSLTCTFAAFTLASSLDRSLLTFMPLMASSRPILAGGASSSVFSAAGLRPAMGLSGGGGMDDLGMSTGGGGAVVTGSGGGGGAVLLVGGGGGAVVEGGGGGGAVLLAAGVFTGRTSLAEGGAAYDLLLVPSVICGRFMSTAAR
mmetsp:Transcript_7588/g.12775  ORF Transcript_7588/g.12775 Transcript_7588/m.12775 type:complete len:203 (-) Transcript_7588:978-1586(-)